MRHHKSPGTAGADASEVLADVSSLLWDERDLLGHLLFKLVEEQLVLVSGQTRWLAKADDELRTAIEQLQGVELLRAAGVDALSRHLGHPISSTLRELAERAPEPWCSILIAHRDALRDLVTEIESVATRNRSLLTSGADAAQQTLDHITAAVHAGTEGHHAQ